MIRWLVGVLVLVPLVAHAEHEPHLAEELDDSVEAALAGDKKAAWLADKATRDDHHDAPAPTATHPLCLRNMWTDEILPVQPDARSAAVEPAFDQLTRCHFTQQSTAMAPALLPLVRSAAAYFKGTVVDIVSGYRAPKYQLMLRKKGHEVARDSEHPRGEAVDFRLPSVPTKRLLAFVRKQRLGGVGYYPVSAFVHADVGRVRYWRGH